MIGSVANNMLLYCFRLYEFPKDEKTMRIHSIFKTPKNSLSLNFEKSKNTKNPSELENFETSLVENAIKN